MACLCCAREQNSIREQQDPQRNPIVQQQGVADKTNEVPSLHHECVPPDVGPRNFRFPITNGLLPVIIFATVIWFRPLQVLTFPS